MILYLQTWSIFYSYVSKLTYRKNLIESEGSKRTLKEPKGLGTWKNPKEFLWKIQFFSDTPQWQANVGLTPKCFKITSSENGHRYRHAFWWSYHGLSKQTNNCSFAESMKNMIIFLWKIKGSKKSFHWFLKITFDFFYGSDVHSLTWLLFLSQFLTCKQIE